MIEDMLGRFKAVVREFPPLLDGVRPSTGAHPPKQESVRGSGMIAVRLANRETRRESRSRLSGAFQRPMSRRCSWEKVGSGEERTNLPVNSETHLAR